ncbi:MAG: MoaD/ThiS family protein [Syntrophobacteraceae bacterium]|jgi:molybdopterin converting factor small subunit|nr:MoaD/ThiS family protein [Syntrophobacteraceae bacterium]
MRVEVRLYATLRRFGPEDNAPVILDVPEGTRLIHVIESLGIPDDVEKIVLVSGRPAEPDSVLNDGDRIVMFPPVAGG